jgi:hypothetical protein
MFLAYLYSVQIACSFFKETYFASRLVSDFRTISEQANKNPEDFISNPVNSFLLIKKLNADLQEFINLLNNHDRLNGIASVLILVPFDK